MSISKFGLDVFGEMVGAGVGLVVLQTLLTIKNGTSPFNFQSNELFYDNKWSSQNFYHMHFGEIRGLWREGVNTFRSL